MKFIVFALGGACLLFAGCSRTLPPDVIATQSPVDATAAVKPVRPLNVLGSYTQREPVDPGSWRKLNEQQSPAPGGS